MTFSHQIDPQPQDSRKLGSGGADRGEYRMYCEIYQAEQRVSVELAGKRNDDWVYRHLRRFNK